MSEARSPTNTPTEATGKQAKLFSRNFVLTWLATFSYFVSYYLLMPTLPIYIARLGVRESGIGLVIGAFFVSCVFLMPFVGRYLDQHRHVARKDIMSLGTFLFAISSIAYIFTPGLPLLTLIRLVHGTGDAIFMTTVSAFIADIIPPSRRGEGMSYHGISINSALVIAPPLGVFVMNHYGFTPLFLLSAIMAFASLPILRGLLEPEQIAKPQSIPQAREVKAPLISRKALLPSLIIFSACFSYSSIVTFLPLFATHLGITEYGVLFSIYSGCVIAARLVSGRLSDKYGRRIVIAAAIVIAVLAMWLLAFSSSFTMLAIFSVLFGVGFGSVTPVLQAFTVDRVEPQERGAAMATFWLNFNLGIGLGSMLMGVVLQLSGFTITFIIAGLVTFIGLPAFVIGTRAPALDFKINGLKISK